MDDRHKRSRGLAGRPERAVRAASRTVLEPADTLLPTRK